MMKLQVMVLVFVGGLLVGCEAESPSPPSQIGQQDNPQPEPALEEVAAPEQPPAEVEEDPGVRTVQVTLKNSEEYEFSTGMGGDEQGARVSKGPAHAVKSEMVPWTRVSCIGMNVPLTHRSDAIRNAIHTRLPVVDEHGLVEGVLPVLNALLNPETSTKELLVTPLFLTPETPVRDALQQLRKSGVAMAIVTGANKKPAGIVTLKDLVEPIVGELGAW